MQDFAIHAKLLSDAGVPHAFFTRRGGVSSPPYDSLNFSAGVGDSTNNVEENLHRAASHLHVAVDRIWFPNQVHRADVHVVSPSDSRESVQTAQVDALVSSGLDLAIGVRVADCAPILLADRHSGLVAVAHSGWRGTVANIAASTLKRMRDLLASDGDIVAVVGPHIESCCFEVDEDVARLIVGASNAADVVHHGPGKPHVNLRRVIHAQLRAAGLEENLIEHVPGCTFCDRDKFFSFRRDGASSGRMLSAIVATTGWRTDDP